MSLYIGNDNNGRGILHITSTEESVTTLKNGPVTGTVFHNDLVYKTWTKHPKINSTYVDYGWIAWSLYQANSSGGRANLLHEADGSNDHFRYFTFEGLPSITSTLDYYILDENDQLINPNNLIFYSPSTPGTNGGGCYNGIHGGVTDLKIALGRAVALPDYDNEPTGDSVIGSIVVLTDSPPIGGNTVTIEDGDILIDSTSLLDFKYVASGGVVNNHPSSITIDSSTQLIDAGAITGSLELLSNNTGTFIQKGGHNIIQSTGAFSTITSSTAYTIASGTNIPRTYAVGDPLRFTIGGIPYNTIASHGLSIDFGSFDDSYNYGWVWTKKINFSGGSMTVVHTLYNHANNTTQHYSTELQYETFT